MTDGEVSLNGGGDGGIDTASKTNMGKGEKEGDCLHQKSTIHAVHGDLGNTEEPNAC